MRIKTAMQDILSIFPKADNDQNDFRILLMYFLNNNQIYRINPILFYIIDNLAFIFQYRQVFANWIFLIH